jgi:hypothetical protein
MAIMIRVVNRFIFMMVSLLCALSEGLAQGGSDLFVIPAQAGILCLDPGFPPARE